MRLKQKRNAHVFSLWIVGKFFCAFVLPLDSIFRGCKCVKNSPVSQSGVKPPGQFLRIWAMAEDAGQAGFNSGFGTNIWNNSESDPAVLINPSGEEVSRR